MDNYNAKIEAVVSIRHLARASSENWTTMKKIGALLENDLTKASKMVEKYGSKNTKDDWKSETKEYAKNLNQLKSIMTSAISKIKEKNAQALSEKWNHHHQYGNAIKTNLNKLKAIGKNSLPESETSKWDTLWSEINHCHNNIRNEAQACDLKLKMIEQYSPEEVDEISDTILKHIPIKYSKVEAHKYTTEYMKAYEKIKKEVSQKKNLWDKFLNILAGGTQQTPAQRVMMQRWVDGEKGELH